MFVEVVDLEDVLEQLIGLDLVGFLLELASYDELDQFLVDSHVLYCFLFIRVNDQRQVALLHSFSHQDYFFDDQLTAFEHVQLYLLLLLDGLLSLAVPQALRTALL